MFSEIDTDIARYAADNTVFCIMAAKKPQNDSIKKLEETVECFFLGMLMIIRNLIRIGFISFRRMRVGFI